MSYAMSDTAIGEWAEEGKDYAHREGLNIDISVNPKDL